jgi:hypothetical protein
LVESAAFGFVLKKRIMGCSSQESADINNVVDTRYLETIYYYSGDLPKPTTNPVQYRMYGHML